MLKSNFSKVIAAAAVTPAPVIVILEENNHNWYGVQFIIPR